MSDAQTYTSTIPSDVVIFLVTKNDVYPQREDLVIDYYQIYY